MRADYVIFSNNNEPFLLKPSTKILIVANKHTEKMASAESRTQTTLEMDLYQYTPFKSSEDIRILHIQPGKKEDPIICSLSHISFASKATYKALSYTWGIDSKTHTVYCAGKVLHITANLHSALRRFREEGTECIIWADAICINQNDIAERNQQVQIMRHVYASASEVVIWLGEEVEGDERAFLFINSFDKSQKEEFPQLRIDWDAPEGI